MLLFFFFGGVGWGLGTNLLRVHVLKNAKLHGIHMGLVYLGTFTMKINHSCR